MMDYPDIAIDGLMAPEMDGARGQRLDSGLWPFSFAHELQATNMNNCFMARKKPYNLKGQHGTPGHMVIG